MDTVEHVADALRKMSQAERERIGREAGVPFDTVQKIALGQTENPRVKTFLRLARVLESQES